MSLGLKLLKSIPSGQVYLLDYSGISNTVPNIGSTDSDEGFNVDYFPPPLDICKFSNLRHEDSSSVGLENIEPLLAATMTLGYDVLWAWRILSHYQLLL